MKVENRTVYIADDGEEFDSYEMCFRHETIKRLAVQLAQGLYVDLDFVKNIAENVFDSFDVIKKIMGEE